MIMILHGDDIVSSKNKLEELRLKASGKEIILLDGEKIEKTDLVQSFETQSLFMLERLIIIENLLTMRPSRKRDELIKYVSVGNFDADIIFWDDRDVTPAVLKKLPQAKVAQFKPSGNIFRFVESIRPKGAVYSVPLFREILKSEPPEIIFVMIIRQLRNILLSQDKQAALKSGLPSWQLSKYSQQGKHFTDIQLMTAYRKLLDIEYKIKTGQTPLSLTHLIDIFLLNL